MGTGPACKLAAHYGHKVPALILLSPFTSLKNAVKSLLGSFPSILVRERFENIQTVKEIVCPTMIIHGQKDTVVPYEHSVELHANCRGPSKLVLPPEMTHNEFAIKADIIDPISSFLATA